MIPRDAVPEKGLSAAVVAATYPLPRAHFTKDSWTLEPPEGVALLGKIRKNGLPLRECTGLKPLYGIKTGFNEAFLINGATRDRLIGEDSKCANIIRPYLRGQDIDRWKSPSSGLYMIVLKSSADFSWPWADAPDECEAERRFKATYPSLHAHMKSWESHVEGETGNKRGLRHREDQGRFWWELRPCAYYDAFAQPKTIYQVIQFYAGYSLDEDGRLLNDKAFFLPTADRNLIVVLNSPVLWWFNWRFLTHLKDEALSPMAYMIEQLPIAPLETLDVEQDVNSIVTQLSDTKSATAALRDWLHHEFGLNKLTRSLTEPHKLDSDGFVTAVRAALPKTRNWSSTEIARIKQEYTETLTPAREAAADILARERKLSDLVNAAYGLTPEEVALMWRTAPPRMPLDPTEELRRLALPS